MHEKDLVTVLDALAQRRGAKGFTFDDLARVAAVHRARLSDIAEWLARGRSSGRFEDLGFDRGPAGLGQGPRRYRLVRRQAQPAGRPGGSAARGAA